MKLFVTVSSIGYVSSAAKVIPMGIIGTKNIAPTIIFIVTTQTLWVGKVTAATKRKTVVPKQYSRVISKYFPKILRSTPEVIEEITPQNTTLIPKIEMLELSKPIPPNNGATLIPNAVFNPTISE